ncbi:methyltransferase [Pseudohongiella nitratireducens]|uniref:class I SAM-dependent methyltransferase n=1 Tax=Pseudohongiella nitratireducens TaxID=1768907 RepID=UPI0030EDD123|tara:strand:+ start:11173 stop:12027 length:855 start_codon:yes stop_codon:yes gene_type:complete
MSSMFRSPRSFALASSHFPRLGATALLYALLTLAACSGNNVSSIDSILNGEHRSAVNKARDAYRHPAETLAFFDIAPDDVVIEIFPGGGWYTEILAPYLRDEGKLIAAGYPRDPSQASDMMMNMNRSYADMLASYPDVYDQVEVVDLHPRQRSTLAAPGTVDAVLDFRNAHNWMNWGAENMLSAWHEALKPGGIVGIVDHRMDADRESGNGYIHEQSLIDVMETNGFEFVASSEVNANPNDTKDHPGGVWNLPPNLRGVPEDEQQHYLTIGESDRLTMLFRKPQ